MNPSAPLPFPAQAPVAPASGVGEKPPHGDLVTVTRVFNPLEAQMLRGCLESEGIPVTLGDVQMVQTYLVGIALGGIRVMVPAPFADAARLTLQAIERGALEIDELPAEGPSAAAETETPSTPGWSHATWIVLAVVVAAILVF